MISESKFIGSSASGAHGNTAMKAHVSHERRMVTGVLHRRVRDAKGESPDLVQAAASVAGDKRRELRNRRLA